MDQFEVNARLEGVTKYAPTHEVGNPDSPPGVEIEMRTVVLITCGLTQWKDEPFRAELHRAIHLVNDLEEHDEEKRFSSLEELSSYLEQTIKSYKDKGFEIVRYKATLDGQQMNFDWLNGVNLPPD